LIQTEERNFTAVEAITAYRELSEVDRGLRELKDILRMWPIYHRKVDRVGAHLFVSALSFPLDRALEKKLAQMVGGIIRSTHDPREKRLLNAWSLRSDILREDFIRLM
jgi:transposase